MTVDRSIIRRLIAQCDPQKPLEAGSPLYVPFDKDPSVRGEQACIDSLRRTIFDAESPTCQLFTGFPGTGKTSELLRLAGQINNAPPPDCGYVLYINCEEYIHRFFPVSVTDVLSAITYCVAREADRLEKTATPPGETYLRQFFDSIRRFLPTSAHLQPKFELYGLNLMLELRNNRTIHDEIEEALRKRFQDFVRECYEEIGRSLKRIRKAIGSRADRFIVIADGLEKIDAMNESQRESIENSIEALFVAYGDFLRLPSCHVIYTFPVWLRFRTAQLGSVFAREPLTLPMVKIHDRDGNDFAAGLDKMYKLVACRLEDPERIFGKDPVAAVRPILTATGGYPRDVLRILRNLLQNEEQFPVAPARIERAIKNVRQTYHDIILRTDAALLKEIADTHRVPTADRDRLRQFGQLFARYLILAYRNGDEWFDLHPMVRGAPALMDQFGDAAP
ncbi:hypothetical protein [Nannocystis punicea]|uniref:AAA ATPase domain-containing protein n=1 Tax=Nannocystis punicea TaxID=2995304 RepID=A0ABY7GSD9_9BACT|nr:hypothetical protein [Nannocystis poenicansa]WAS89852.1 hypothetical protein O0S08_26975 [Nannocystis poenicansa]